MTPTELRTARKALGLTQHGLAKALGMGKWGFQSVAKWEKGLLPIPEHRAITIMLLLKEARLDTPRGFRKVTALRRHKRIDVCRSGRNEVAP